MLCRLVLAGAQSDVALAQKHAAQLPAFAEEADAKSMDVAALQAAALALTPAQCEFFFFQISLQILRSGDVQFCDYMTDLCRTSRCIVLIK